jgi:uncharacterized protein YjiS (DUF1127 family)
MDPKLPPPLNILSKDLSTCRPSRDVRRAPALQDSVSTWASVLRTQIAKGLRLIGGWMIRASQRNALADFDNHLLRDVGVSRIDARSASAKPRMSHEGWIAPSTPPRSW